MLCARLGIFVKVAKGRAVVLGEAFNIKGPLGFNLQGMNDLGLGRARHAPNDHVRPGGAKHVIEVGAARLVSALANHGGDLGRAEQPTDASERMPPRQQ